MSSGTVCGECGEAIPADSPGGFCGRCLLRLGLGSEPARASEAAPPDQPGGLTLPDEGAQVRADDPPTAGRRTPEPPDHIGRYRLVREIGHGGCGVVYLANQEAPVRRTVALKVIKLGMDTRQVVARFEAERQALALMDHPNIARALDAGATESGRPYFVMELVSGIRITEFCDRHRLTMRQRLELFVQVCRAVQHAHQKGVIHRDLKPSNVLVGVHDGVPVPKVIDFGIAKATQGRLSDFTLFTASEQLLGTPAYMSPEQAQVGGLDVDTRSDIYSLGVLLYELLTGKTPFDTQEMVAGGLERIRRTILETDPARPSTRLSTMDQSRLNAAAEQRRSTGPRLVHLLRGDLDWVVMRCLEKDRARRYETANALASDLERYLNHEPVWARPPSTLYTLHKFIRRNRLLASAATAIATILVVGITVSAWETTRARRAEREQRRLREEAYQARLDATEKLWASYLAESRAIRLSGQAGRRFESLSVLRKAAAIKPSLALRNEAIASMVLPDMQCLRTISGPRTQQSVSLSPGLDRYAVCDRSGAVSVRRVADDHEETRLPDLGTAARMVWEFSPGGWHLPVHYADGRWRVWDLQKRTVLLEVTTVVSFRFAPDSHTVVTSDGTNIVFHDLGGRGSADGRILSHGLGSRPAPGWFRFDPVGARLALHGAGAGTETSILEIPSGRTLLTLRHPAYVYAIAWHPDGRQLATASADGAIHLWDAASGELLRRWSTESCISLAFNRQGDVLASSGWDGYTRLWDPQSGRPLASIYRSGHLLGFGSDDRTMAIANWECTHLDFFEVASSQAVRTLYDAPERAGSGGGRPAIDPGGRLLAFRTPQGIGLWDLQTLHPITPCVTESGMMLAGFDADAQNLVLTGQEGLFRCPLVRSEDGATTGLGKPLLLAANLVGMLAATSANGRICAVVGNNCSQVFCTATYRQIAETGVQPGMRFIDLSPDGSMIATGAWQRPGVRVWDVRTGALVKELQGKDEGPESTATVAFTPDARHLVVATMSGYAFWDTGTWSFSRRIPQPPGNDFAPAMAFSRDGSVLAGTHSRNKIRLHNATTGEVLADLEAPNSRMITGLAFNRDGTRLAACESNEALRVWDLAQVRRELTQIGLDWK